MIDIHMLTFPIGLRGAVPPRRKDDEEMRNFLLQIRWSILWVASLLVAQPAWTQTSASLGGETADRVSRGSSDPDLRSEVEQLKQLVREQQRRIEALETQQGASAASGGAVTGSATLTGSLSVPLVDHVVAVNPPVPSAPGSPQTAPQQSNAQYSGSSDERI